MKAVFETATIADSVTKAARVAPTKGEAFDKASGILMELDPEDNTVTIRSTNLKVFYLEVVDAIEVTGEETWRIPSAVLSAIVTKLPIGTGKTVTMEKKGNIVHIASGKTKAQIRTSEHTYFPEWGPFDPDKLEMVPDLGARIQQVEWAAHADAHPIDGIHLDGANAVATDRIRMAIVPCEAEPIYKPITIPAGILKPVLSNLRDVAIGIDEGMFLMMPDTSTQIRTRIYDEPYPDVPRTLAKFSYTHSVKVSKNGLLEIMDRAAIFASTRDPRITFIIGKGEIAVMCSEQDMGLLGDVITCDEGGEHDRHKIMFTPKNLLQSVQAAPSDQIEIHYNMDEIKFPIKIDGGSGYMCVIMPRNKIEGGGD